MSAQEGKLPSLLSDLIWLRVFRESLAVWLRLALRFPALYFLLPHHVTPELPSPQRATDRQMDP